MAIELEQVLDEIVDLLRGELARVPVAIAGVVIDEHFAERRRAAIVEVRRVVPETDDRRSVEPGEWPVQTSTARGRERADVVEHERRCKRAVGEARWHV